MFFVEIDLRIPLLARQVWQRKSQGWGQGKYFLNAQKVERIGKRNGTGKIPQGCQRQTIHRKHRLVRV